MSSDLGFRVEAMGLEPTNLLTASQALYQLSYAPEGWVRLSGGRRAPGGSDWGRRGYLGSYLMGVL